MSLTGFLVGGSILGTYIFTMILLFIITYYKIIRSKGFLNGSIIMVVVATFTGIGAMIGSFINFYLIVILSLISYVLGLKISLYVLEKQGNKLVVTSSSIGDGYESMPYDNFDEDDFNNDD